MNPQPSTAPRILSGLNSQPAANQRGGLGNLSTVVPPCGTKVEAHQLFGDGFNELLEELNETLAA
jgi:hypothetical protein